MRYLSLVVLTSALALPARAEKKHFKELHASDLAAALKSEKAPTVLDANNKETRKKDGVIPGAKLLSSSSKYSVKKELPADKGTPLVFYCANTMCMASHSAADKALSAGYGDVSVMVDGIQGWKSAGQPVVPLAKALKAKG
jgi:rhodanese-related sulfurtransferase